MSSNRVSEIGARGACFPPLHPGCHIRFAGFQVDGHRDVLINDLPLAVGLAQKIGLPKSCIERFAVGTHGGKMLHTAGQGELAVADHLQFDEIDLDVLKLAQDVREMVADGLVACELARRTHHVEDLNIIARAIVLERFIGGGCGGELVLDTGYRLLIIGMYRSRRSPD
jgi:hypothetical protein